MAVPVYLFQGQPLVPGPTLRVQPGDVLIVCVTLAGYHAGLDDQGVDLTDLTIHGLHLAQETKISRPEPGVVRYEYFISKDQPPGGFIAEFSHHDLAHTVKSKVPKL